MPYRERQPAPDVRHRIRHPLEVPGAFFYLRRWGTGDRACALPLYSSGNPACRPRPGLPAGITPDQDM